MKIFDCFTYLDEDLILDLRLNVLNKYVDKFIIVESKYRHNGEVKKQNFDINNFKNFKNKIEYIFLDKEPENLLSIKKSVEKEELNMKALYRDNFQRNSIELGLNFAENDDFIIISDIDEIPNLKDINFKNYISSILLFKQKMFYYKFNLFYEELEWYGSKACTKKLLKSPQWLRNLKNKRYPLWRIDALFSEKKFSNIEFINNGGWHFTNINSPEKIFKKLETNAHHIDFAESGINLQDLKNLILQKKIGYDHFADQKTKNKWTSEIKLKKIDESLLPNYIIQNKKRFQEWLEL